MDEQPRVPKSDTGSWLVRALFSTGTFGHRERCLVEVTVVFVRGLSTELVKVRDSFQIFAVHGQTAQVGDLVLVRPTSRN